MLFRSQPEGALVVASSAWHDWCWLRAIALRGNPKTRSEAAPAESGCEVVNAWCTVCDEGDGRVREQRV